MDLRGPKIVLKGKKAKMSPKNMSLIHPLQKSYKKKAKNARPEYYYEIFIAFPLIPCRFYVEDQ